MREVKIIVTENGKPVAEQLFMGVKPKELEAIVDAVEDIAYKLSMGDL